jgi:hypothetical protein
VYNKVADSVDVVIQERGFSIVDTHEPVIAMPLSPFCLYMMDPGYPHGNKIFLAGCHQEVCRFVSPGLRQSVGSHSHCGMSRNERLTSISPGTILCHQQAFRTAIYWDQYLGVAKKWSLSRGEMKAVLEYAWWGDLMILAELYITLLVFFFKSISVPVRLGYTLRSTFLFTNDNRLLYALSVIQLCWLLIAYN